MIIVIIIIIIIIIILFCRFKMMSGVIFCTIFRADFKFVLIILHEENCKKLKWEKMLVKFILAFSDTLEDKLTAQHNALQGINYTFLFSKCLLKYPTFLKCVTKK